MNNNLLENLNQEQLEAVMHQDGPVLIVAGAGTGKTTVITQRIAYLIEQGKARSDEILALTFTEKAAGEMEERVDRLLPMGYLDLWISTFHSFGERILKTHGLDIGLPAGFKLLNEFEQWSLIQKNLDKFDLNYYRPLGNPTKFIHALVKHFSRLKDEDISPQDYLNYANGLREDLDGMLSGNKKISKSQVTKSKQISKSKNSNLKQAINSKDILDTKYLIHDTSSAEQEASRINEIANAYHTYQQLLLDNNALDFGDLINYSLKLFRERPGILAKYRQQFKYILLDEFQDTNWAQYELIKLLAAPRNNLVVVGDDDQSVYKFRGASVSNILQFKKDYPQAKEIFLTANYRNAQNILDLSYQFIQLNNPNRLEYQLNKNVETQDLASLPLTKKLRASSKDLGTIEVIQGVDLQDEIKMVLEKIAELKIADKEANWSDFGILVRANDSAKEICTWLDQAGLPYQYLSSRGLYAKPVIMDAISYLKLLDNYHESAALYRVLNLPVFKFKYNDLVNFNYWARKKAWSLYEVLKSVAALNLGADMQTKVNFFLGLLEKHTALVREGTVSEIFLAFLNDSGYLKFLAEQDESKSREIMGYLNQFMKRLRTFESASDDKSVKAFLSEFSLELESGEQGSLPFDIESGPDAIKVMTVHGAKGLEFKYVFIVNMVDKRFPTIERSEQIPVPDALVKEILPEGDIHLEEERRLFYVAMTRAKRGLYFSYATDYGGARAKKPSRFLVECKLVDEKVLAGKTAKDHTEMIAAPNKKASHNITPYTPQQYISFTQLAAFNNCPYQYRFAHILKIPMRGKAVFSFGKTMHSALQKLFTLALEKRSMGQSNLFGEKTVETPRPGGASLQSRQPAPKVTDKELQEIFQSSWIDEWYESKKQKEEYKKMGIKALRDFYEKYKDNWPNTAFLEKSFNYKMEIDGRLYTIKGTIDRIDETGQGLKIIDYKTGGPKDKLLFDDKEQLLIYQKAAADIFDKPVASLAYYYLENNSEIEFIGTDEELEKIETKVVSTINEISKGEFPPKPSLLCNYCDFKDICEFRKI